MLLNRPLGISLAIAPVSDFEPVAIVRAKFALNKSRSSGWTDVAFDTAEIDNGWGWTPGNAEFVVPSGVSIIIANFIMGSTTYANADDQIRIYKNAEIPFLQVVDNQFWHGNPARAVIPVTPGDEIKFKLYSEGSYSYAAANTQATIVGYP